MDFVQFPRFSCKNLPIWFAQVESAFALNGIVSDSDKYDYVVTHIPAEFTTMVEDILLNPPIEGGRYGLLKYEFIKRMSVYHLQKEQLGDMKPSEYLRRLREVADQRVSNDLILNVWLNNLPEKVREIVGLETTGHVDTLCEMADKVMALIAPTPLSQLVDDVNIVLQRIDEVTKTVNTIFGVEEQQSPGQKCAVPAVAGSSKEAALSVVKISTNVSPKVICWYHTYYGDNAMACIAPCQYNKYDTTYYYKRQ